MASHTADVFDASLVQRGFAFVSAVEMRALLTVARSSWLVARRSWLVARGSSPAGPASGGLEDWEAFRASWNDLPLDAFMADGGRYRRRRHAVFTAALDGTLVRQPHQPHYQSREYNPLNGGIPRWFAPVEPAIADGRTLGAILTCAWTIFGRLAPARQWRIEVHQFRIEARQGELGQPTPEGVHRDGVDYVLVLLIDRVNIVSGTTTVHALDGELLGSFTLTTPLDAAILDDARVAHGVTAIEPLDARCPAYRDVIVVTFKTIAS